MNILQISYFLELSKRLSFKKTAEALYVSQPAISMQIKSLESEWGITLFLRDHKNISLTPAGEIMRDMFQNASTEYQLALLKAKRTQQDTKTVLNIGIPEYSQFTALVDFLADYQSKHPELLLNIKICPISELVISDYDNKFDIALNHEHILQNQSGIKSIPFIHTRKVFLISNKHPLVQNHPDFSVYHLGNERLYIPGYSINSMSINSCLKICGRYSYAPREIIDSSNVQSALLAAKMGFGVAMLDSMVDIPKDYDLRSLRTSEALDYVIVWNEARKTPHVTALVKALTKQMADITL